MPPGYRACSGSLFEHDLFGKPVSTFPDHALENRETNISRSAPAFARQNPPTIACERSSARAVQLYQMEIVRMSFDVRDRHARQHDLVMVGIGDDRVLAEIDRLRAVDELRHALEQRMVDIDRVAIDIEVADRCTAEVRIEDKRIVATMTENGDAAADMIEHVILRRAVDH